MNLGIEKLLQNKRLTEKLKGKRVGLVAHPASVNHELAHSVDLLAENDDVNLVSAFGPQHGIRGDKQYNMIESDDFVDSRLKIPVHSLYGEHRRPTEAMLSDLDVVVYDLQDLGCRIYTYLTTLIYVLEECARYKKSVWVLDRPNPVGRPIEGYALEEGFVSFVGAWAEMPMRHGMTSGELALAYVKEKNLDVELEVVSMDGYSVLQDGGWPVKEMAWVNPSPNIATLAAARVYTGTVLFEGLSLSEGRGTTRPLEIVGAPDFPSYEIISEMKKVAPELCEHLALRPCFFEPTFDKFQGKLCEGIQVHADHGSYEHEKIQPYRSMLVLLKACRNIDPAIFEWRQPPYEYEHDKLPIDLLNGETWGREWVDDSASEFGDLDKKLQESEKKWSEKISPHLLY